MNGEARSMVESATHGMPAHAVLDAGEAQPAATAPFIAADGENAERLDAAAGCEFVDDRIRLRE